MALWSVSSISPGSQYVGGAYRKYFVIYAANLDNPSGVINNVLYVIILSAALDLVGPSIPKGVVLIADVLPSFLTKLVAPYFIHLISYPKRVIIFVTLSMCGMLLVALTPETRDGGTIAMKMVGVVIASLSSGGGELSFISLTHYYGHFSLAAWASGTGGAGLIGAGAYVAATTWIGWSVRGSLLAFSFLPVIMLVSFFAVLPQIPLKFASSGTPVYDALPSEEVEQGQLGLSDSHATDETAESPEGRFSSTSLSLSSDISSTGIRKHDIGGNIIAAWQSFKANLSRSRHLFFP